MRTFARLLAAVLAGAVAAVVLVLALTAGRSPQPYIPAASVTKITLPRPQPNPQITDGLYKSVVYIMPGGETFICILTQLPQSFPHFTIPPGYSCAEAAGSR